MPNDDESPARLRGLIDGPGDHEVDRLLAEARTEARARVLAQLTDAFAETMRERVTARLAGTRRPEPAEAPGTPPEIDPAPLRTAPVAPARRNPGELAWYVYGVIAADDAASAEGLPAIEDDHPVTSLSEGALAAAVSNVALEEFAETRLRHHLSDMSWVEATARAHEETLEQLRQRATVIPMRMCSVYRTEGGVREMLRREQQPLVDSLDHLEDKSEWGVKVFSDPTLRRPQRRESCDAGDAATSPGAGAAYMERRREERDAAERVARLIEQAALHIHEQLCAAAADGRASEAQPARADDRGRDMILDGVYLVRNDDEESFHDRVRELRDTFGPLGLELRETGPWPAYNFVPGTIGAAW